MASVDLEAHSTGRESLGDLQTRDRRKLLAVRASGATRAWEFLFSQKRFGPHEIARLCLGILVEGSVEDVSGGERRRSPDADRGLRAYKSLFRGAVGESYEAHL